MGHPPTTERPYRPPDQPGPGGTYLSVQSVMIYVRDVDRSLKFYVDQLGFKLVIDVPLEGGQRWVVVAPQDGMTNLALVTAQPGSEQYSLICRPTPIIFVAEDVVAKYNEWCARGVRFLRTPQSQNWGGVVTSFEDLDGNSFTLVGFDEMTRRIEEQRREATEKREAEQRAAQELDIAKQVQARLFPQISPPLRTLDYAGVCLQARAVGGDYYDFLDLGSQRAGLLVADVSGKGIAASLMMANLQASLRGRCAIASDQPLRFLQSVNKLFMESTDGNAYATLFFAEYDDQRRLLRYANCGHFPGLLLRNNGVLELLPSTSTVVGLFRDWDCPIEERQLFPGDTLMLYTDGVTESTDAQGEEFGEERIVDALRRQSGSSAKDTVADIVDDVQRFSRREEQDDITLIVAKCR